MASGTRISQLAETIATNTAIVDAYLKEHGLPTPSFSADGPASLAIQDDAVTAAQERVIASTQELHFLMKGPAESLLGIAGIAPNDALSLQAVYHYEVSSKFPPDAQASYQQLATACGVNEVDLRRLLRHAMTNHIFQEVDGKVEHTAATRILRENEKLRNVIGIMTEEMFQGASRTIDALDRYGKSKAPNECGYSIGHNTSLGIYDYLSDKSRHARSVRYAEAMSGLAARTNADPIAAGMDWSSYRLCIDVGGGWGPVAIELVQRFPKLKIVVEDLPHVIEDGPRHVPDAVKDSVSFRARNIRTEKATDDGADVYLFRHVFHNFPDQTCVEILRNQCNAIKARTADPRGHIVIYDAVVPEPQIDLPEYREKLRRSMDLNMLTFFGARERTLREWTAIVREADPTLQISYAGSPSNLLDIHY